jgi:hypothetical protein
MNTALHEDPGTGQPSVAAQIAALMCPNECSESGECVEGECVWAVSVYGP